MSRVTCGQCVYWDERHTELGDGYCRRGAPSPTVVPLGPDMQPSLLAWPLTDSSDWCGQARAREPEAESVEDAARFVVTAWRRLMLAVEHQHPFPIPAEGALVDTAIADLEKALERAKP